MAGSAGKAGKSGNTKTKSPGKKTDALPSNKPLLSTQQEFIDRIYECAFVPELWPDVLDELARPASASGGILLVANDKEVTSWTASASLRAGVAAYVSGEVYRRSERTRRVAATRHTGFLR
jgi:hypothetical protein